jgi:DNA processing protein
MQDRMSGIAAVLAATEVIPAGWFDLSDLLELCGEPCHLLESQETGQYRGSVLLEYLRRSLDPGRIDFWRLQLRRLLAERPSIDVVTVTDSGYPRNLRSCYNRPPFLFIDGYRDLVGGRALAIVGSRSASTAALSIARQVAVAAADAGVTVVSGLARGVDAAAHEGAIAAGGRTIAVLPSGIDAEIFPREHTELAERIRANGTLLSQFRPGSPPTRSSFVARNGVISGLSKVNLLVAGGSQSGTNSEAEYAIKQRRAILLWEPIIGQEAWARRLAELPGVRMVTNVDQVLDAFEEADPCRSSA